MLHAQRKLAAMMLTDIVGYTSLTQKDELLALELLEEHRRIVRSVFSVHRGKEIKTIGDAFLVEFSSALEAVKCGYEIQRSLREYNLRSEPSRKIMIRVGIHVGDIFYSDDEKDVYGNSVNIASRIEPLADPGGICITGQVYDLVRNNKDLTFENLGEHDLKNVEVPIGIFKVNLPWEDLGRLDKDQIERRELIKLRPTLFVGRTAERAQLGAFLEQMTTSQGTKRR